MLAGQLFFISPWRTSSQSSASSSILAVASLEPGAMIRLMIMARTRSRGRLPSGPRIRSRPVARMAPRTAATWPWGSERIIVKGASPGGSAVPPFSRMRSPSTRSAGQFVRLRSVRFLTLPPSRQVSRKRTAGGELRLGTVSMNMEHQCASPQIKVNVKSIFYMGTYSRRF